MEKNINHSASTSLAEDNSRESIAVIGGGPGAMSFCHAIESQRKELLKSGEDVSGFPVVKCFERAPGPGGVWRSDRQHENKHNEDADNVSIEDPFCSEEKKDDDSLSDLSKMKKMKGHEEAELQTHDVISSNQGESTPNMYSALWTNGPKEGFEFPDYTFLDHFGDVRMPTFLPRKHVLDYIIARCTTNCPNFFEKYFSFRTSVVNVSYEERKENERISEHSIDNKFRVHTRNEITGIEEINIFDKCIWAGGTNGIPYIPTKLLNLFKDGGFKGRIFHSSDSTNFKEGVENKRVLIIGGGLSAEDVALMAIKEGASRIFCTFRGSDEKEMSWTTRWPYDKVEVCSETTIVNVEGNTVTIQECYRDHMEWEYELCKDEEAERIILNDIDTVIFCTGYSPNVKMLDPFLQDAVGVASNRGIKIPKDWTMNKDEEMKILLGKDIMHVKPSKFVYPCGEFEDVFSNLYRGCLLIENPNMMYMVRDFSPVPLTEIDIMAWMLARYATGQKKLPTSEEMRDEMDQITLKCMENITLRYKMDARFNKKIEKILADDDSWSKEQSDLWDSSEKEAEDYHYVLLGGMMKDGGYPYNFVSEDGTSLSEIGKKIMYMNDLNSREIMHEIKYDVSEDSTFTDAVKDKQYDLPPGWMTFRDIPNAEEFVSVFTGMKSCRLAKPWFELDENDKLW